MRRFGRGGKDGGVEVVGWLRRAMRMKNGGGWLEPSHWLSVSESGSQSPPFFSSSNLCIRSFLVFIESIDIDCAVFYLLSVLLAQN